MISTRVGQEHGNDFKQSVKEGLTKLQSRNNKCEGRFDQITIKK
jgi:hypothetical protein